MNFHRCGSLALALFLSGHAVLGQISTPPGTIFDDQGRILRLGVDPSTQPPPPPPPANPGSIEGVVINSETGLPVRDATVTWSNFYPPVATPPVLANGTVTTDAEGRFTITGMRPGQYRLIAARDGLVFSLADRMALSTIGNWVSVAEGSVVKGVELPMVSEAVISGIIVDARGQPAGRVSVSVMRQTFDPNTGAKTFVAVRTVSTNDRGEYRVFGLERGNYHVAAMPQPMWPLVEQGSFAPTFYPGVSDIARAETVAISSGQQLPLSPMPLQKLSGAPARIRLLNIPPDANRRSVYFQTYWGNWASSTTAVPVNAADPSEYVFRFLPAGRHEFFMATSTQTGSLYGRLVLNVTDGAEVRQSLALEPAHRIAVRVVRDEGAEGRRGVSGMYVGFIASTRFFNLVATDAQGSAIVDGIGGTHHRLEWSGLPGDVYVASATSGGKDILESGLEVAGNAEIDVVLRKGSDLAGVVTDSNKRGVPNATVVLVPAAGASAPHLYRVGFSDSGGRFHLSGIAPGEFALYAWRDIERGAYRNADFMKDYAGRGTPLRVGERESLTADLRVED